MQTNTIPAGGIERNGNYHNSQTIYGKWDEKDFRRSPSRTFYSC